MNSQHIDTVPDFIVQLQRYAELLVVHGLNVQPGQIVNISTEVMHRDLALLIAEQAYRRGAKLVQLDLIDPRIERCRIEHTQELADLTFVPRYLTIKYEDLVANHAANLKLIGSEEPDSLCDLSPQKINSLRKHQRQALHHFYEEGIGKAKVHWTVAAAATPKWAQKVFPNATPEQACVQLWQQIFTICRVQHADFLQRWQTHNHDLQRRAAWLTQLQIAQLHFVGPGTDLKVGLSPHALFKGGSDKSQRGVEFEPNIPTEECFTTPDLRLTEGYVRITRPFDINGTLIRDATVRFAQGALVDLTASEGAQTFREYLATDNGAKYLGEVALVGIDSPIYQTDLVFSEILFDENAACHIAIGSAYQFCLQAGETLSQMQLETIGCNQSAVHTDMMISCSETAVFATTHAGMRIQLIRQGRWIGGPQ